MSSSTKLQTITLYLVNTTAKFKQWRSQDITYARAQHGHTTFLLISARSAEALRGSGGIIPLKIFYSFPGQF